MAKRSRKNKPVDVFKEIEMHNGDATVCWEWKKPTRNRPYFDVGGHKMLAYRITYELANGVVLMPDQIVRHKCDNPICCNPWHLEIGTHQENMNDMKQRERHGLSHHAVRAIKRLLEGGETDAVIAERFGLTKDNVAKIRQGKSYKHVTIEENTDEDIGQIS